MTVRECTCSIVQILAKSDPGQTNISKWIQFFKEGTHRLYMFLYWKLNMTFIWIIRKLSLSTEVIIEVAIQINNVILTYSYKCMWERRWKCNNVKCEKINDGVNAW